MLENCKIFNLVNSSCYCEYQKSDILNFNTDNVSTSQEGAVKRKLDMPRYIVDGFVFHVNIMKGQPPMT